MFVMFVNDFSFRLHINDQSMVYSSRYINPQDITISQDYIIEIFAEGLDAPSSIAFTGEGDLLIAESGYITQNPRILRLHNGQVEVIAEGFDPPVTGVTYHNDEIYVSHLGKITVIRPNGTKQIIIDGFPRHGDYWGSNVTFGPEGKMYFGQGTQTNSGVVGRDNSWLYDHPFVCDHPGEYIMMVGQNFVEQNIFSAKGELAVTGAFSPYGIANMPYEVKKGINKASGAIMRANTDGSELELISWGFRYPLHVEFDNIGRLFAANQSYEVRGSRPIANAPDEFLLVIPGQWYGWPDYVAGEPVTEARFKPEGREQPEFLLLNHPNIPSRPYASFPSFSYIAGFDFNYNKNFGPYGDVYIAEFGGGGRITPGVETPYLGFGHRISKIDMLTGGVTTFAMNKSGFPSSITREGGFSRPVDVKFGPDGAMYILDLGLNMPNDLSMYIANTGVIWKVTRA